MVVHALAWVHHLIYAFIMVGHGLSDVIIMVFHSLYRTVHIMIYVCIMSGLCCPHIFSIKHQHHFQGSRRQGQVVLLAPTDGGGWDNQTETIQRLGSQHGEEL